jgi:hypothetical protein
MRLRKVQRYAVLSGLSLTWGWAAFVRPPQRIRPERCLPVSGRNADASPSSCFFEGNPKAPDRARLKEGIVSKRSGPANHFRRPLILPRNRRGGIGSRAREKRAACGASAKLKAIRHGRLRKNRARPCSALAPLRGQPRGVWAGAQRLIRSMCQSEQTAQRAFRRATMAARMVCQPSEGSAQPFAGPFSSIAQAPPNGGPPSAAAILRAGVRGSRGVERCGDRPSGAARPCRARCASPRAPYAFPGRQTAPPAVACQQADYDDHHRCSG